MVFGSGIAGYTRLTLIIVGTFIPTHIVRGFKKVTISTRHLLPARAAVRVDIPSIFRIAPLTTAILRFPLETSVEESRLGRVASLCRPMRAHPRCSAQQACHMHMPHATCTCHMPHATCTCTCHMPHAHATCHMHMPHAPACAQRRRRSAGTRGRPRPVQGRKVGR